MKRQLGRRLATYLAVLVSAILLNFVLPRAMPGDPLEEFSSSLGGLPVVPDAQTLARLRAYYGLDQPLIKQFYRYVTGLFSGDWGISVTYRAPVLTLLGQRAGWSLFLIFGGFFICLPLALYLGINSGMKKGADTKVLVPGVIFASTPPFVLASLFFVFFCVKLPIFPVAGAYSPFMEASLCKKAVDILYHSMVPMLTLAAFHFYPAYLVVRNSIRLELNRPYVLMAHIKGIDHRRIRYGYILRCAQLPIITFLPIGSPILSEAPSWLRLSLDILVWVYSPMKQFLITTIHYCKGYFSVSPYGCSSLIL